MEEHVDDVANNMELPPSSEEVLTNVAEMDAPLPPSSHKDAPEAADVAHEGKVEVVEDAGTYTITPGGKARDARWVRGLSPQDELDEMATEMERARLAAEQQYYADARARILRAAPNWLRAHNALGLIFVMMLAYHCLVDRVGNARSHRIGFPHTDEELQRNGIRRGEPIFAYAKRVLAPLLFPHLLATLYSLAVCFSFGTLAHDFIALCGIGLSLLGLLAAFTQVSALVGCCGISPVSRQWECDVPLVFYWLCSYAQRLAPCLALACLGPLLDRVRRCGFQWTAILLLPAASVLAGLTVKGDSGGGGGDVAPANWDMLVIADYVVLATWTVFLLTFCRQDRDALRLFGPATPPL